MYHANPLTAVFAVSPDARNSDTSRFVQAAVTSTTFDGRGCPDWVPTGPAPICRTWLQKFGFPTRQFG
jgi:hypothetical protein